MGQIFISYSSEDTEFARRLAGAFEDQGWSVWWDKQIPPGMDYAQVIEAAVKGAQCVVVLWSQRSIRSRWVHTEAAAGADRNIVATVIIDDIPNESIPFEFKRLQAVNLSDWRPGVTHPGFELLANRIRSILNEPPSPDSPVKRSSGNVSWKEALTSWGTGRQRGFRIGGAIAGLLGVTSCTEAIDMGDTEMLSGALFLLGIAVWLIHLGRKPS